MSSQEQDMELDAFARVQCRVDGMNAEAVGPQGKRHTGSEENSDGKRRNEEIENSRYTRLKQREINVKKNGKLDRELEERHRDEKKREKG